MLDIEQNQGNSATKPLLPFKLLMKIAPGRRNNLRYFLKFCLLITGICCGPIYVGQIIGYTSPAMLDIEQLKILTTTQISLFASLMNIGGMIGSLLVGNMLDVFGRKWTQVSTAGPVLIGWLFIGWAANHGPAAKLFLFYVGRMLTGVSAGMCMTASSVYLIEIAPTAWRGAVGCCNQLGITIGIFLVYFFGMIMKDYVRLAYFGSLFPFLMVLATLFAPESPRWLLSKGRRVEAGNALSRLREPYYDVEEELRDIEESLIQEKSHSSTKRQWRDYMKPDLLIPLRIAVGLMIFQQLSGINAIMFYTAPIFESAGYGAKDAYKPPIFVGLVQVFITIICVRLMDRHGRRYLLGLASFLMCTSLFCLCIFYSVHSTRGWMALICLAVYIIGFSIGWGPIPMLISAEVFPMWARSLAGGVSVFSMWLTSFVVTQSFPSLRIAIGPGACFGIFGGASVIGVIFVRKFVPETKGKSLEEIQLFFASRAAKSAAAAVRSV